MPRKSLDDDFIPLIYYFFSFSFPIIDTFNTETLWLMVDFIGVSLQHAKFLFVGVGIKYRLIVDCKKISIFFGRNHGDVFYSFCERNEPRFVLLKIKVNIDKDSFFTFWKSQSEFLFIPALTDPTYISIKMTFKGVMFSRRGDLISVHSERINGMEDSALPLLKNQESSRIYKAIVTNKMNSV